MATPRKRTKTKTFKCEDCKSINTEPAFWFEMYGAKCIWCVDAITPFNGTSVDTQVRYAEMDKAGNADRGDL